MGSNPSKTSSVTETETQFRFNNWDVKDYSKIGLAFVFTETDPPRVKIYGQNDRTLDFKLTTNSTILFDEIISENSLQILIRKILDNEYGELRKRDQEDIVRKLLGMYGSVRNY